MLMNSLRHFFAEAILSALKGCKDELRIMQV
jgi:hypothetical protein